MSRPETSWASSVARSRSLSLVNASDTASASTFLRSCSSGAVSTVQLEHAVLVAALPVAFGPQRPHHVPRRHDGVGLQHRRRDPVGLGQHPAPRSPGSGRRPRSRSFDAGADDAPNDGNQRLHVRPSVRHGATDVVDRPRGAHGLTICESHRLRLRSANPCSTGLMVRPSGGTATRRGSRVILRHHNGLHSWKSVGGPASEPRPEGEDAGGVAADACRPPRIRRHTPKLPRGGGQRRHDHAGSRESD